METNTILSKNIKAYRQELKIGVEELSNLMGISRQSIALHQSGKRVPTCEHINKYAQVFGITPDTLKSSPHSSTWNFVVLSQVTWQ